VNTPIRKSAKNDQVEVVIKENVLQEKKKKSNEVTEKSSKSTISKTEYSQVGIPLSFMTPKRGAKIVSFTYDIDDWTSTRWTDKEGVEHTLLELFIIFSRSMKSFNGYVFNLRQWCEKKKKIPKMGLSGRDLYVYLL